MKHITYGFLLTSLAGLSTLLGTIPIFFRKHNQEKLLIGALSFAAGVMFCVSVTDLLPESLTLLNTIYAPFNSILITTLAFLFGIYFSMLIDHYLPDNIGEKKNGKLYRIGIFSMIAIILHNIPEGIATFMATNHDYQLGIALTIAIALHNIPEGISISVPIYYATKNRFKASFYTFLSGISEPFGALLTYLFLSRYINDFVMGILMGVIAGIMSHIAFYELLPTSKRYHKKKITYLFFGIGILFMLISHVLIVR